VQNYRRASTWLVGAALLLACGLFALPFLWMVSTSLKDDWHVFPRGGTLQLIPRATRTEKVGAESRPLVTLGAHPAWGRGVVLSELEGG